MKRFEQFALCDKYVDKSDPLAVESFQLDSYGYNRADGISFLRNEFSRSKETRRFLTQLRSQFKDVLQSIFGADPMFAMLSHGEDLNHFLVLVGYFAETESSAMGRKAALSVGQQIFDETGVPLLRRHYVYPQQAA